MKTKITSKNKNIINIKINTGKNKKRKQSKPSSSGNGKSSYNSGYSMMPPIIYNAPTPSLFPNNQPQYINNTTTEPVAIKQEPVAIKQEPVSPKKEPVSIRKERLKKFNNTAQSSTNSNVPQYINALSNSPFLIVDLDSDKSSVLSSIDSVNDNFNKPQMVDSGTQVYKNSKGALQEDTPKRGRPSKSKRMARMEAENVITPNQRRYREESDEDSGYDSVWISPGQQDFI
jgi:hypothetical protein